MKPYVKIQREVTAMLKAYRMCMESKNYRRADKLMVSIGKKLREAEGL